MKNLIITLLTISFLAGISGCSKNNLDSPPAGGTDPNIKANFSLDSLLARYSGSPYLITDSLIISAVVVGDDSSGTFYHGIDIEDSTGGIMLMIDGSYLYNLYPVGTRVFVSLKGLYLVTYKGVPEIVAILNPGGTYTGIPSSIQARYITTGKWGINVVPKDVTVSQLNANPTQFQSQLIRLSNVQFSQADLNFPYYIAANYGNTTLRDCGGEDNIDVYTSAYTDFGNLIVPSGNGTFVCVYSQYNGTPELLIRTPSDLNMTGPLCP